MPHTTNAEKSHVCVWTVTGLWFTWQISLALLLLTIVIYIYLVVKCWRLDSQGWIKKNLWTVKQSQCHFCSQDLASSCNNYLCFGCCGGLSLVILVVYPPWWSVCPSQAWFDITFAGAIRPAEHCALLYAAERLEHLSHIGVRLLFSQHTHKQLPVF